MFFIAYSVCSTFPISFTSLFFSYCFYFVSSRVRLSGVTTAGSLGGQLKGDSQSVSQLVLESRGLDKNVPKKTVMKFLGPAPDYPEERIWSARSVHI